MFALHVNVAAPRATAAAILFAVNVTAAVPLTPSNIGVFQAACIAVLSAAGVAAGAGLAYGILLQGTELVTPPCFSACPRPHSSSRLRAASQRRHGGQGGQRPRRQRSTMITTASANRTPTGSIVIRPVYARAPDERLNAPRGVHPTVRRTPPRWTSVTRVLILTADIGAGHELPAALPAEAIRARAPAAHVSVVDGRAARAVP